MVRATRLPERCELCGVCERLSPCRRFETNRVEDCTGCGACALACPNDAVRMVESEPEGLVTISVDNQRVTVPVPGTVKKVLEILGFRYASLPQTGERYAPCGVGACYSCAALVDGKLAPTCVTPVQEGMTVVTSVPASIPPLRIVQGWSGHRAGGVGTPWFVKGTGRIIEAAVFACGCNLRCPQCQNWAVTYNGAGAALTPQEAAGQMTLTRRSLGVDRMAISGGESTLNRPWLLSYLACLKQMNPDPRARLHVDTNATILTRDYIDALVDAGMTDIGADLKGLTPETFMRITGMQEQALAQRYLTTAWDAVRYLADAYRGTVFTGVGIPYNPALVHLEEIVKIGEELVRIDPDIQVCILDYRPEFRRLDLRRPSWADMGRVWKALDGIGLTTVLCQTVSGYIGPRK